MLITPERRLTSGTLRIRPRQWGKGADLVILSLLSPHQPFCGHWPTIRNTAPLSLPKSNPNQRVAVSARFFSAVLHGDPDRECL